jgi:UDP-N-acetylmuramyl pentapeptide phosphotransferase/UDP-N-acetylglucosamine-1-phosphate transferase
MKKLLFITLIALASISLKAQTDSLITNKLKEKDLLDLSLQKANSSVKTGGIMVIGGFAIALATANRDPRISNTFAVIGLIGIPIWIGAADKRNRVEIQIAKYEFEQTTSLGLKLKIKF